jgi:hypothetical protein
MYLKAIFQEFPPVCLMFVYSDWLGVIYDSQVANRSAVGEKGALTGIHPFFLLDACKLDMTPSRTALHFFIVIWIRVNLLPPYETCLQIYLSSQRYVFRYTCALLHSPAYH